MPDINYNTIEYKRWMAFKTADHFKNREVFHVTLHGFFRPNLRGQSNYNYRVANYFIELDFTEPIQKILPDLHKTITYNPSTHQATFYLKNWTVFGGLNTIYNKGPANDLRHSVRWFVLEPPPVDEDYLQRVYYDGMNAAKLKFQVGVKDNDDELKGVAFRFTGLLAFAGWAIK